MQPDTSKDLERLWGAGDVRVFISHKSNYRWIATQIQERLQGYGVASFVSHKDIKPMTEWESEMRRALFSADVLVALLTSDFIESKWTDQEVGIAIGRGVPVIPVQLGCDPYGFIGKYQAIPVPLTSAVDTDQIASNIYGAMLEADGIAEVMKNMYVNAVRNSPNWDTSNALAHFLPSIQSLTPIQAQTLVDAFNNNLEVSGSFGFKGVREHGYEHSLAVHLARITGYDF